MSSKRVCVVVFGPTGAGKSQFINFSLRDLENKTNVVSDSLNSCTTEPKSNILERCGITIDLIDTAGSNDTGNKDIQNLQKIKEDKCLLKEIILKDKKDMIGQN